MTIDEFIKSEITKPFVWGQTDCCSTANRWVLHSTGIDVLQTVGINFSNFDEAQTILSESLIKLFVKTCKQMNFEQTVIPEDGDVGLIKVYEGGILAAAVAIRYKNSWFSHAPSGCFMYKNAEMIRSYRCRN